MVKNKVPQKTILAIILVMLMYITMSVSSLAWDGYPDTPISDKYDNSYKYQVIFIHGGTIWMKISQNPFYYTKDRWNNKRIGSSSTQHRLEYVNGNWEYWGNVGTQEAGFNKILESTHDIYTDSSLTDVFFSATRIIPTLETLTKHPPLTLMSHQLRGIIPFLIGLLIALVAFWKAWQFLFKTLRKA